MSSSNADIDSTWIPKIYISPKGAFNESIDIVPLLQSPTGDHMRKYEELRYPKRVSFCFKGYVGLNDSQQLIQHIIKSALCNGTNLVVGSKKKDTNIRLATVHLDCVKCRISRSTKTNCHASENDKIKKRKTTTIRPSMKEDRCLFSIRIMCSKVDQKWYLLYSPSNRYDDLNLMHTNHPPISPELLSTLPIQFPNVPSPIPFPPTFEPSIAYNYPSIYEGHFSAVIIPHSQINSRTFNLASIIHSHYPITEPIVLLCILKGSSPFFCKLASALSQLKHPYVMEFIRLSSYVGTQSSGDVKVTANNDLLDMEKLRGKNVLLVEDIVDTGNTLTKFMPMVKKFSPKTCEVCTLLIKRLSNGSGKRKIVPKYVGFSIPDEFVVGYGLDYNEMYRDLEDLWILNKVGIEFGGMDGFK